MSEYAERVVYSYQPYTFDRAIGYSAVFKDPSGLPNIVLPVIGIGLSHRRATDQWTGDGKTWNDLRTHDGPMVLTSWVLWFDGKFDLCENHSTFLGVCKSGQEDEFQKQFKVEDDAEMGFHGCTKEKRE